MANSPYKTLGNLRSAIINDAKEASSTALITQVNRWVNEGYEQVILRKKRDWLDTTFAIQFPSAVQGIVQVTNGSNQFTFTATLPTVDTTLGYIAYTTGFNELYYKSTVSGADLVIQNNYLGPTSTAAAGVYTVYSILLDPSVREVYSVYHQWSNQPLEFVGPEQFREIIESGRQQLDYAQYCTIFGQNNDQERKRLMIYPYVNTAYTLNYDANVYVTPLSADSDEPVLPMQYRQILYHFGMYKLFSYHRNDAKAGEYLTNFNTMLAKIDGEAKAQLDFPQLHVRYPRGRRTTFFPTFDSRLREDP